MCGKEGWDKCEKEGNGGAGDRIGGTEVLGNGGGVPIIGCAVWSVFIGDVELGGVLVQWDMVR
jgi:hypothetical protein